MKTEETPQQEDQDHYKIWMENAGFLYDRLLVQKLKWPSLTFQWLPYKNQTFTETTYRCLFATHTSGNGPAEHLYIEEINFPKLKNIDEDPGDMPASKTKNIFRFTHEQQINRARCNPLNPSEICARTDEGPVCIFREGQEYPVHLLEGNLCQGFALEWSEYAILSGDFNGQAYCWINGEKPLNLNYGTNVEDVKIVERDLAVIVGDSGFMSFWDFRTNSIVCTAQVSGGEKRDIYSTSVNPAQNQFVLTGGEDQTVKIWDRRNLSAQLHKFEGHQDNIMSVQWSPVNSSMFASGSADKKVKIWDLMRVGFEIPKDLGGTDELLFTHEGHKGSINDLNWNPYELMLGSVEQDENTLQVYSITNNIHELEYAEDLDYLRKQCFS